MTFDLRTNPFYVLNVSPRDIKDRVAEAAEALLVSGNLSDDLALKTQSALSASKSRLAAELSWLLELAPNRAIDIKQKCLSVANISLLDIVPVIRDLEGLACANLAAHFCSVRVASADVLHLLISSWAAITVTSKRELVNENRKIAGFPEVTDELVGAALEALKEAHAGAALDWLTSTSHAGKVLTDILEKLLKETNGAEDFLERIAEKYSTWAIPSLKSFEEQISTHFTSMKESNTSQPYKEHLDRIVSLLREWDEYSQPLQLLHQRKGLDEPRARRIFEAVREIPLWLANEKQEHVLSLEFSRSLLQIFPELPISVEKLEDDIKTLTDLVEQSKAREDFAPLMSVLERILKDENSFNRSVLRGDFATGRTGIAADLFNAILATKEKTENKPHSDEMWSLIRKIAIYLCNEKSWIDTAITITTSLKAMNPPEHIRLELEDDIKTLNRNLIGQRFAAAVKNQQTSTARDLAKVLVDTATDEKDRKEWNEVYATLFERRTKEVRKAKITAAVIGGIILWAIIASNSDKKKTSYQSTSYRPSSYNYDTTNRYNSGKVYQPPSGVVQPRLVPTAVPIQSAASGEFPEPWNTNFKLVVGMLSATDINQVLANKKKLESAALVKRGNIEESRKLNALGLISFNKRQFSDASKSFQQAVQLDDGNVEAWNNLGYSQLKENKLDDATVPLLIALSLAPGRAAAWANFGELLAYRGDEQKSHQAFILTMLFSSDSLQTLTFMERLRLTSPANVEKIVSQALWTGITIESKQYAESGKALVSGSYWGQPIWPPYQKSEGKLDLQPSYMSLSVSSGNCTGQVSGEITQVENVWSLTKGGPDQEQCQLFLVPGDKKILVVESKCQGLHGFECGFSGLYKGNRTN